MDEKIIDKIIHDFKKMLEKKHSFNAIDPVTIALIIQVVMKLLPIIIAMGKEIVPIFIKYIPQIIEAINKGETKLPGT